MQDLRFNNFIVSVRHSEITSFTLKSNDPHFLKHSGHAAPKNMLNTAKSNVESDFLCGLWLDFIRKEPKLPPPGPPPGILLCHNNRWEVGQPQALRWATSACTVGHLPLKRFYLFKAKGGNTFSWFTWHILLCPTRFLMQRRLEFLQTFEKHHAECLHRCRLSYVVNFTARYGSSVFISPATHKHYTCIYIQALNLMNRMLFLLGYS